jgi:hypothetical protein
MTRYAGDMYIMHHHVRVRRYHGSDLIIPVLDRATDIVVDKVAGCILVQLDTLGNMVVEQAFAIDLSVSI